MKVIASEKIPVKMWLDDIDEGAKEQAKNLANLPFRGVFAGLLEGEMTELLGRDRTGRAKRVGEGKFTTGQAPLKVVK